jgi:hypothetical protein
MFQEKRRPNTQLPTSKFFFFFFPWLGVFFPSNHAGFSLASHPECFLSVQKEEEEKIKKNSECSSGQVEQPLFPNGSAAPFLMSFL